MRKVMLGLALLVALGIIGYKFIPALSAKPVPLKDQLKVSVTPNADGCDAERPIGVVITNPSELTVTEISFSVSVKRTGYSSTLESQDFDSDKIIYPSGSNSLCVPKPLYFQDRDVPTNAYTEYPAENLDYYAKVSWASALPN